MKFIGSVPVTNGGTNPDPVTDPADVLAANLIGHDGHGPLRTGTTQRLLLGFQGTGAATTTTVELWALDEATNPAGGALADRRFYRIATGVVLTHLILTEVAATVPARGPYYVRQTAGAVAGTVRVAVQDT